MIFCRRITAFVLGSLVATAGATAQEAGALSAAGGPKPEQGIAVADWLLYPVLSAGIVVNDNVYRSTTGQKNEAGFRISPGFEAYRDTGMHKTNVYGSAELSTYAHSNAKDNLQARVGIGHAYEIEKGLVVRGAVDYTRQNGAFGGGFGLPVGNVFLPGTPVASSTPYNQFSGSLSIEKAIGRGFVNLLGSAQATRYESLGTNTNPLLNFGQSGVNYSLGVRAGYWVLPVMYAFVEPSAQWRRYDKGNFDTHGYRVIAGLGSEQIGLLRGEVYAGYQGQRSDSTGLGSAQSPLVGAKLYYYPTRYLTFTASLDQDLGVAAPTGLAAGYSKSTRATLVGNYAFSPYWSLAGRAGYSRSSFDLNGRVDETWLAGAGLSYNFWRNISLTLDYQHTDLTSNVAGLGYKQNVYSAGLTYRY